MTDAATRTATATATIESAADVAAALAVLCDPTLIPIWAPDFADDVATHPVSGWEATKEGRRFALRLASNAEAGTVDYLRQLPTGRESGAYIRVIPRPGDGSVITISVPVAPGTDQDDALRGLNQELTSLVTLITGR